MAPLAHSKFSASASARLLACPGSYAFALAADDGKRRSSIFAAEGTLAHSLAEAVLQSGVDPAVFVGDERTADGFVFEVDEDMADGVRVYTDFVRGLDTMGYHVQLEQRVSPVGLWGGLAIPDVDLFGTSDVVAIDTLNLDLRIVDLKFGRGVPVEVKDNPQLLYYAAGALAAPLGRKARTVTATIIQPRSYHPDGAIRSHTYTADYVRQWARTVLYEGVIKALSDNGATLSAGKHCRFCPVAATCETLKEYSFQTAKQAYLAAPITNLPASAPAHTALPQITLSADALGDILNKIEVIEPWMAAVKQMAKDRLAEGTSVSGWKLVPTRANRKWADSDDEEQIAALGVDLVKHGIDPTKIVTTKLKSPAQVEKSVGKKAYALAVQQHVVKASSGATMVPEIDPRSAEARRSAQEAFGITPGGGATATLNQP